VLDFSFPLSIVCREQQLAVHTPYFRFQGSHGSALDPGRGPIHGLQSRLGPACPSSSVDHAP
jgi:hypothetical protein